MLCARATPPSACRRPSGRVTDEGAAKPSGIEVQIRVGLNSGEVVLRSIASDLRMDYTAVGQTTHLAARMERLAPPGAIRLTLGVLQFAEGFIEVKALGPIPVKGVAEPVEVFELTRRYSRPHAPAGNMDPRLHPFRRP